MRALPGRETPAFSSDGAKLFRQAGGEVLDTVYRRDFIRIDLHLELILELEDDRNQVERVERKLFEQQGTRCDHLLARFGRNASNRSGDGGEDFRVRIVDHVDRRVHGTPRLERRSKLELLNAVVETFRFTIKQAICGGENGLPKSAAPLDDVRLCRVSRNYHRTLERIS